MEFDQSNLLINTRGENKIAECLSPFEELKWLWSSLSLKLRPHILPTLANETIGEEIGNYYPVFYIAFAPSWQPLFYDKKTPLTGTLSYD